VGKEAVEQAAKERTSSSFIARVIHFENRYKTINALLSEIMATNILELSAGFSFRGLNLAQQQQVFYVDTDLPDMVNAKQLIVNALMASNHISLTGQYLIHALNVLDEPQFEKIADLFPAGPLTIVNEGLLVYLNGEEKTKLCRIIHALLKKRGGCWITGDIYIRKELPSDADMPEDVFTEQLAKFLADHKVDENKFESFEAAAEFFNGCGFVISRRVESVYKELTFLKNMPPESVAASTAKLRTMPVFRETWMLEVS